MLNYLRTTAASSLLLTLASGLSAAQFTMGNDINGAFNGGNTGTASWSGTNPNQGFVGDAGVDALDGYGYLQNLGAWTVQRQVDRIAGQNVYRWLDIFTNPTGATQTRTIRFIGDLGSDNGTVTVSNTTGMMVTRDNNTSVANAPFRDPVLAHVSGNNFTGGTLARAVGDFGLDTTAPTGAVTDDYRLSITLTLGAGQSVGILNFLAMALDTSPTSANFNADIALATSMGQSLLANPILTGLTNAQIGTIRNFNVATPEPGTLALLAVGISGLALARRRKAAAQAV